MKKNKLLFLKNNLNNNTNRIYFFLKINSEKCKNMELLMDKIVKLTKEIVERNNLKIDNFSVSLGYEDDDFIRYKKTILIELLTINN